MRRRRLSFTEHRQARLAMKVDRFDRLETRNTITEPISVLGLSTTAFRGLALIGIMQSDGGGRALAAINQSAGQTKQDQTPGRPGALVPTNYVPIVVGSPTERSTGEGGGNGTTTGDVVPASRGTKRIDWLDLNAAPGSSDSESQGISTPWHPTSVTE